MNRPRHGVDPEDCHCIRANFEVLCRCDPVSYGRFIMERPFFFRALDQLADLLKFSEMLRRPCDNTNFQQDQYQELQSLLSEFDRFVFAAGMTCFESHGIPFWLCPSRLPIRRRGAMILWWIDEFKTDWPRQQKATNLFLDSAAMCIREFVEYLKEETSHQHG